MYFKISNATQRRGFDVQEVENLNIVSDFQTSFFLNFNSSLTITILTLLPSLDSLLRPSS